jgi:parallel beta-helix repeat protein
MVWLLLAVFSTTAGAKTIYVDDDEPADFNNIQAAIDDSNDGDMVIVLDGTYRGTGNHLIHLRGKDITVCSQNGPAKCVIDCWPDVGFYIRDGEGERSVVRGFTITRGQGEPAGGILTWGSSPTIINNVIKGNYGGAIDCYYGASPRIINNIIVGNGGSGHGGGIYCYGEGSSPLILNNTIADNYEGWHAGIDSTGGASPMSINCILWNNSDNLVGCTATYSCIEDGDKGEGNIHSIPMFVLPGHWDNAGTPDDPWDDFWVDGDYHLKSQAGRWYVNEGRWTRDEVTSPCIDAGDPASPIGYEPFPNGGIINMGAYGGTAEASKSYFGEPVCETIVAGDINGDCKVDFKDFAIMAFHWLKEH